MTYEEISNLETYSLHVERQNKRINELERAVCFLAKSNIVGGRSHGKNYTIHLIENSKHKEIILSALKACR